MPVRKITPKESDSAQNESVKPELPVVAETPKLPEPEKSIKPKEDMPLVVDERMIPYANLPTEHVEGILDIANEGSGLLRPSFAPSDRDVYISASQIRRFNLRLGDRIGGQARRPKLNERYWGLLKVESVNGLGA